MEVLIIGGGAAGFFAAITCAKEYPGCRITILEQNREVLAKVRISGGGRCNVTHACFEPNLLVERYPRGGKALLGPFHQFHPGDIVEWFEKRGIRLKTEADGRIFPVTDKSQTIIDGLTGAARDAGISVRVQINVTSIIREGSRFCAVLDSGEKVFCDHLLLATGSGPKGYEWAQALGHSLEPPVPSLFTFTISDPRLKDLEGISVDKARLCVEGEDLQQEGSLLITHWGLSGPAVLKLSAWGARVFHERRYRAKLVVNWIGLGLDQIQEMLEDFKKKEPRKSVLAGFPFKLPRRLWERLVAGVGVSADQKWAALSFPQMKKISQELFSGIYEIRGKSAFKEEFVTCGGVRLDEVHFKTMESRRCPGLYFAGEILDIDGVTGGFNFQSAWTTGYLAGRAMGA